MDREKLDGWCEKGILGLVLAILVTAPLLFGGTGEPAVFGGKTAGWHFLPLQAMTMGVMGLWLARFWTGLRVQLLWPPICWAVAGFAIYAVVRYCYADLEYPARQETIQIVVYAFLFFAILNNLHRQESTRLVALTLVFLGMTLSFYAVYQFIMKSGKVWNVASPYSGRGSGTFINPNNLAGFLEMLAPLGFCYLLAGRLSHLTKVLVGYASLVMLAGIAVTVSRGGMVAIGVVLLGLCGALLTQQNYRIKALLLLAALIASVYFVAPRMQAVHVRFTGPASGNLAGDVRWHIWRAALEIWHDHLWFGVGPGLFDSHFREYRMAEVQQRPLLVHNDYLNTLADYGLVGTLLVGAAWVLLFVGVAGSWRDVRGARDDFARKKSSKFAFLLGSSAGLLAILIHSALDFNLHVPADAILAVTLMALVSSQWRFATEQYWFTAGPWRKSLATVVVLAGMVALGYTGWHSARENTWLDRAGRQPLYSHEEIAALKQAWEVEPKNPDTTFAIAECYWQKSMQGSAQYVDFARQAMDWYRRGMALNPRDGYNWLGYGRCVDWMGADAGPKREDSEPYFHRANELDPNGAFTTAQTGWHYAQIGDYAAARTWLQRSLSLQWRDNLLAERYLALVDRRMQELAGVETKEQ